jgi:hypothetical protein
MRKLSPTSEEKRIGVWAGRRVGVFFMRKTLTENGAFKDSTERHPCSKHLIEEKWRQLA